MDDLTIFKAFNPYYAVNFLMHYKGAFVLLGAVFLCTTGAEALYSDLGLCGRKNIRISWLYVKICLLLNYIGQGSYLLAHNSGLTITNQVREQLHLNSFYNLILNNNV